MFGWLTRWFWKRSSLPIEDGIYKPEERLLYEYHDGEKWIKADPMSLFKRYVNKGPELWVDIKVAGSIHPDNWKAHEKMLSKFRDIFSVKPYEEGGLTEIDTIELFEDFMAFSDNLKKKRRQRPISAGATSGSTGSSSGGSQPTPNMSGSGSPGVAPSTEPPQPPPSEPESPSGQSVPTDPTGKL